MDTEGTNTEGTNAEGTNTVLPPKINNSPPVKKTSPKKQGSSLSFWLAIIFGFLFLLSTGINVIMLVFLCSNMMGTPESSLSSITNEKFVDGDKNSKNKVLLIPVEGAIIEQDSESSFYEKSLVQSIIEEVQRANDDKSVKAVIFSINSPGGGVTECDNIYHEILKLKANRPDIKIVVSMKDIAASGGYYISAPALRIFAQPTTITGSIGVIMEFISVRELFGKIGLETIAIKSGKLKDIGSSTREMTKEEKAILENMINEMYKRFIGIVIEGREGSGRKLTDEQIKEISDGRIFTASQALKVGLVDEIGYLEDAFKASKELAGLQDARLVKYRKTLTFFDFLEEQIKDLKPQSEMKDLSQLLPLNPRLMYMWTAPGN